MGPAYYVSRSARLVFTDQGELVDGGARKIWWAADVSATPFMFAGFLLETRQHGADDADVLRIARTFNLQKWPKAAGRLGFSPREWRTGELDREAIPIPSP